VRKRFQALPQYYNYYSRPVKFLPAPDGGMAVWKLSWETGGWEAADEAFVDEIIGDVGGEVFRLDKDRFVDLTEATRGELIRGDGPVHALYETVEGILADARREHRGPNPTEKALIQGIRKRTYAMFEAELASRGDPAADV
jgi:hypothetical protein